MNGTTNNQTKEQQIENLIKQGVDRATATRIVNAKPAKSTARGSLNGSSQGFSLLK